MSFQRMLYSTSSDSFHYLFPGEHRIPSSCFAEDPSAPLSSDDTAHEQQNPENQYALHLSHRTMEWSVNSSRRQP